MPHPVVENKWKSQDNNYWACTCRDWLIDLAYNRTLKFFATRKEFFFRIFQPILMALVALCQNKMANCTATVLYVLKFQSNFWNKNDPSVSDSNLMGKSKAVSSLKLKWIDEQSACQICVPLRFRLNCLLVTLRPWWAVCYFCASSSKKSRASVV